MRICLVLEGSYPYVHGGVSTWMHEYIQNMPEHEFVLWVIGSKPEIKGKFVYELPKNVTEVVECFLEQPMESDKAALKKQKHQMKKQRNYKFREEETRALTNLIACDKPDWEIVFDLFHNQRVHALSFLQSEIFMEMYTDVCMMRSPQVGFSDAFHSLRSMLLPLLNLLETTIPKAEVYHSIVTGYGGVLASFGSYLHKAPLVLTEHGIYTREREEEIIRSNWVLPSMKDHWIRFFYTLSDVIYSRANKITSLFSKARLTQIEMGCDPKKCVVVSNGISFESLSEIPLKVPNQIIDIGAIVRMAPIKDIKTMIYSFFELTKRVENVRLHIMGGEDDHEYAMECYDLAKQLCKDKIIFPGRVDIKKYMEQLDFTILTSLSEGQPLSILESMAAGRPCVTTDVGCCIDLLQGRDDDLGLAGYIVAPGHIEGLASAYEKMCENESERLQMGVVAKERAFRYYRYEGMINQYKSIYEEVVRGGNRSGA